MNGKGNVVNEVSRRPRLKGEIVHVVDRAHYATEEVGKGGVWRRLLRKKLDLIRSRGHYSRQ